MMSKGEPWHSYRDRGDHLTGVRVLLQILYVLYMYYICIIHVLLCIIYYICIVYIHGYIYISYMYMRDIAKATDALALQSPAR